MKRIFDLLRGKAQEQRTPVAPPCADAPFTVIGDLHGCAELLDQILPHLPGANDAQLVFVGDYVDRGEDSAGVLRRLANLTEAHGNRVTCLKGNHEDMLLKFLDDPEERGPRFLRYGGLQTLASFGVGGISERSTGMELVTARNALRNEMGPELIGLLQGLDLQWTSGNITVVHAGVNPDQPLDQQDPRDLMWGHRDFHARPHVSGQWIAHGHTITRTPGASAGRIATDTGAYATGLLTAIHVAGETLRLIDTA